MGRGEAMIESAVSAFVQVSEISRQYLENRCPTDARKQLGLARSELRRCLHALGLIGRDADDEVPLTPSADELLAPFRERKEAVVAEPHAVSAER